MPQTRIEWTSNQAYTQFRLWKKEVERICNGPMSGDDEKVKLNTVYIWAGAYAETLVEAKQAENPLLRIETVESLLKCLEECLTHSTFFREAREDFYNTRQKPGENTTMFYSRINELYRLAEFPDTSQFLIVDKLIHGCSNAECKRKLMIKGKDVTVTQCLEVLRQSEAVDVTMKHFGQECQIGASYKASDPTRRSQYNGAKIKKSSQTKSPGSFSQSRCVWCGSERKHPRERCPARNVKCDFCKKNGHFEKACILKTKLSSKPTTQNAVNLNISSSEEEYEQTYDISGTTHDECTNNRVCEVLANVKFNTPKQVTLQGKVDTGAMATCMPLSMLQQLGLTREHIMPTQARLRGVTGTDMKTYGKINPEVMCNDVTQNIQVLVTELGTELILGLEFCKLFNLVNISNACI